MIGNYTSGSKAGTRPSNPGQQTVPLAFIIRSQAQDYSLAAGAYKRFSVVYLLDRLRTDAGAAGECSLAKRPSYTCPLLEGLSDEIKTVVEPTAVITPESEVDSDHRFTPWMTANTPGRVRRRCAPQPHPVRRQCREDGACLTNLEEAAP